MSTTERPDTLVIGGGIVGCATAFFLTRREPAHRVLVVEQDPAHAASATARSAGGVRQQFSTPENIALSQFTLEIIREPGRFLGEDAEIVFREQGYLILAGENGRSILAENHAVQQAAGAAIALIDGAEALARRFPWLATDGVAAGAFGERGEGWLDPVNLMTLFRKAAVRQGARFIEDRVTGLDVAGERITGAQLASGTRIDAQTTVLAAGPWSGAIAAMAGVALPVGPRKRFVYVLDCRSATEALHMAPLTVDPSGVWFRPEGRQFIAGLSPEEHEEPTPGDLDAIDHAFFEERVWPVLATRVPAFEAIKVTSAWAGHYDYNALDQNGIIGRHPELGNLVIATGFSGHGLQQGPATGRAVAELILAGRFETIELARFGYERIARGEPLFERNVI
ncbi:MAG: FAD-binding oxidoreductase [Hyphomicrobiaceae bacterium]